MDAVLLLILSVAMAFNVLQILSIGVRISRLSKRLDSALAVMIVLSRGGKINFKVKGEGK